MRGRSDIVTYECSFVSEEKLTPFLINEKLALYALK